MASRVSSLESGELATMKTQLKIGKRCATGWTNERRTSRHLRVRMACGLCKMLMSMLNTLHGIVCGLRCVRRHMSWPRSIRPRYVRTHVHTGKRGRMLFAELLKPWMYATVDVRCACHTHTDLDNSD